MYTLETTPDKGDSIEPDFINIDSLNIYLWVAYIFLCPGICLFGIATNIINIMCFIKQGFNESVNISLLGLSVSDIAILITMIWTCISISPPIAAADLPFEAIDVCYLVSVVPHFSFTQISSCITAMITIERCLSIVIPLKIKSIATPPRTTAIIVSMFIVFITTNAPLYIVNGLEKIFSVSRNRTIIGLVFYKDREKVERITFSINSIVIPFGAFLIIIGCTIMLSIQLLKTTQWRKKTVSLTQTQTQSLSNRNKSIVKMVLLIAILYIVCFMPATSFVFAIAFEPSLFINGKNINLSRLLGTITFLMECMNSSLNIFIYYNMSSKYRGAFLMIFKKLNKYSTDDSRVM